jgi:hypothetical protein
VSWRHAGFSTTLPFSQTIKGKFMERFLARTFSAARSRARSARTANSGILGVLGLGPLVLLFPESFALFETNQN